MASLGQKSARGFCAPFRGALDGSPRDSEFVGDGREEPPGLAAFWMGAFFVMPRPTGMTGPRLPSGNPS